MTSSESNEETSATSMNTAVPGMVKTLKSLLDAAIRERLRLETLLEQVQEVTTRLETLMDQSENRLEQWHSEWDRLAASGVAASPATAPPTTTQSANPMITSNPTTTTSSPEAVSDQKIVPLAPADSDLTATPTPFADDPTATLPGQVAALRERVRAWKQELPQSRRDVTSQMIAMLREGATTSQIAEKLQIPIGEVELMARLAHFI